MVSGSRFRARFFRLSAANSFPVPPLSVETCNYLFSMFVAMVPLWMEEILRHPMEPIMILAVIWRYKAVQDFLPPCKVGQCGDIGKTNCSNSVKR